MAPRRTTAARKTEPLPEPLPEPTAIFYVRARAAGEDIPTPDKPMTREDAWAFVKRLRLRGEVTSIRVFRHADLVWTTVRMGRTWDAFKA